LGKSIKELNPISPFVKAKESHPFDEDSEYLPSIERAKADANKLMERRAKERKEKILQHKQSKGYQMWESIKRVLLEKVIPFVAKFLVRWLLKIAGSIFGYLGISEGKLEEIIIAALCWIVGIIWSLVVDKKSLKTPT